MATARRVVLYGDSVVLAAVGESLRRRSRLDIITVAASAERAERELDALRPGVVILDLGVVTMEFAFALLRDHPNLTLIGLNPGGDRLLILSGEQARTLGTEDLARFIEGSVDLSEPEGG